MQNDIGKEARDDMTAMQAGLGTIRIYEDTIESLKSKLTEEIVRADRIADELNEQRGGIPMTIDGIYCNMHRNLYHPLMDEWVRLESIDVNEDGTVQWNYITYNGKLTTPDQCYSTPEAVS